MATSITSVCKPMKLEVITQNGDVTDQIMTEASPTADYLTGKGISFRSSLTTYIDSTTANNMQFQDATVTDLITLDQLRTASSNIFSAATNGFSATTVQNAIEEAKEFNPTNRVVLYDEFLGNNNSAAIGQLGWTVTTNGTNTNASQLSVSSAQDFGVVGINIGTVLGGRINLTLGSAGMIAGSGAITSEFRILIPTLATALQDYNMYMGLGNTTAVGEPTNGIYFKYTRGTSPNWIFTTAKAGARTSVTGAAISANKWYKLKYTIDTAGTAVTFYVDGVSAASITSNIPSATANNCAPTFKMDNVLGIGTSSKALNIDYFYLEKRFSPTR